MQCLLVFLTRSDLGPRRAQDLCRSALGGAGKDAALKTPAESGILYAF